LGTIVGTASILIVLKNKIKFDPLKHEEERKKILEESEKESARLIENSKKETEITKENLQKERDMKKDHIKKTEDSLKNREEILAKKEDKIRQIKLELSSEQAFLQSAHNAIDKVEKDSVEKLCKITGTTTEKMKEDLLSENERKLREDLEEKLKNIEDSLKENANKTAKRILVSSMQRISTPTSVETRSVLIKVPKDFIKGKIIGRNALNLLEIEKMIDVDIIFNDLPNTISLSAFNLVNRRIAQVAIEKMIKIRGDIDRRLIEKLVHEAERETNDELYKIGKRVVDEMDLNIKNRDLVIIIGRLEYRTSYGQNIMKHSQEVSWVATILANELGLDAKTCRIAGFLHDLGKAVDQEESYQGGHDQLTKELMEKFNFKEAEIHAAWTHHDAAPQTTPEALIVKAADAVSACRPGARQESMDKYVERLQALEETARTFSEVKNTYAISAGRELRVFVDPDRIDDAHLIELAKKVSSKIEHDLSYPGTIKVNIIRRTQFLELAK